MPSIIFLLIIGLPYLPYSLTVHKKSNIGLTPTVTVKATFNTCFKCNANSFISKIIDSSTVVPFDISCNGFIYNEMSYYYKIFISSKPELLVINQLHSFAALLNGNMLSIWNGYISNGTCAGDYIYSVRFSMADDQNACNGDKGLGGQEVVWDMFQLIGKCSSICYGKGFTTITPSITNQKRIDNYIH